MISEIPPLLGCRQFFFPAFALWENPCGTFAQPWRGVIEELRKRGKRPRSDVAGGNRRCCLNPSLMNFGGQVRRFDGCTQKRTLLSDALDHGDVTCRSSRRNDQTREAGTRSEINHSGRIRNPVEQLNRVPDMTRPDLWPFFRAYQIAPHPPDVEHRNDDIKLGQCFT